MTYRPSKKDRGTTEACAVAVAELVVSGKDVNEAEVNAALRKRLGIGWTAITALQWMTGKKAWACIEDMKETDQFSGFPKSVMILLVKFAAEVCRFAGASAGSDDALERARRAIPLESLSAAPGTEGNRTLH